MSKSRIRACFALNIFQFTSKNIEEIRKLNPSRNFYEEIPKWIYVPETEVKFFENYYFQFTSENKESWIMFDIHYKDAYVNEEISHTGEDDFFKEIDLHKIFELIDLNQNYNQRISLTEDSSSQSQPYVNSQEIFHKGLPFPTYVIVDIEYVMSTDYYSGGTECDVYYNLVGYLDGEFNLIKI